MENNYGNLTRCNSCICPVYVFLYDSILAPRALHLGVIREQGTGAGVGGFVLRWGTVSVR